MEISEELYKFNDNISDILGHPDDLKLKSSMTLFNNADPKIETSENNRKILMENGINQH